MRARDLALFTLLLGTLLALLHVWPPISTRGEAREGIVVHELVAGGSWVLPRRQGVIASKPPLYHWLAAGAAGVLGWSDRAVRLPSAIAAWGTAVATFLLGLLLFGDRRTAWLAVGILFASWGFVRSALEARVDMLFAACVTTSIAGVAWWALRDAAAGRALAWLAAAAAMLVKGPAGAVLPALVALAFLAACGDVRRFAGLWSRGAAALAGVLAGGWYLAAVVAGGREFLAVQLLKENIDRFAGRGEFAPHRTLAWLLMPRYFVGHLAPWNLAIPEDLRRWWRGERPPVADRLLHAWWIVVLLVFTAAAGKRAVYLLPLYPAIALLAGRALERRVTSRAGSRRLGVVVGVTGLVMLAAAFIEARREAARNGVVPFANEVRTLVPSDVPLYASLGLPEGDTLVLGYLLQRPILRQRVTCDGSDPTATYYFRPVSSGGNAMVTRISAMRTVELVRCTNALDSPGLRGIPVQE